MARSCRRCRIHKHKAANPRGAGMSATAGIDRIRAEQVRTIYRNTPPGLLMTLVALSVMTGAFVYIDPSLRDGAVIFMLVMIVQTVARLLLQRTYCARAEARLRLAALGQLVYCRHGHGRYDHRRGHDPVAAARQYPARTHRVARDLRGHQWRGRRVCRLPAGILLRSSSRSPGRPSCGCSAAAMSCT